VVNECLGWDKGQEDKVLLRDSQEYLAIVMDLVIVRDECHSLPLLELLKISKWEILSQYG
jgi:hypothetical protein